MRNINLSLVLMLFMLLTTTQSHKSYDNGKEVHREVQGPTYPKIKEAAKAERGMRIHPTGSNLPDCTHACGPCVPCKRVVVGVSCGGSESCPVVYKCFCNGKYFPTPSF